MTTFYSQTYIRDIGGDMFMKMSFHKDFGKKIEFRKGQAFVRLPLATFRSFFAWTVYTGFSMVDKARDKFPRYGNLNKGTDSSGNDDEEMNGAIGLTGDTVENPGHYKRRSLTSGNMEPESCDVEFESYTGMDDMGGCRFSDESEGKSTGPTGDTVENPYRNKHRNRVTYV